MQWVEYYHEILECLGDIAVSMLMIKFRPKIDHILIHFSTKTFVKALNLSSSKCWCNEYQVIRLQ